MFVLMKILDLEIGSVILCPGSEPYDPAPLENVYHYKANANVVTSLEFERILSASGPTMGHLKRPSDDREPRKIAWLQCVGSRDSNQCGNSYCSSVCCMYAIKDSMIAKEHAGEELDCVIFNMDIRTFGKDYEKYYLRAKDQAGVRFVKARVHTVDRIPDTEDLMLRYADDSGDILEEPFDMVVLSTGLEISQATVQLAGTLDIDLDHYHFTAGDSFHPVATSVPGIYACGVLTGPKDIPQSVIDASAAAGKVGTRLADSRWTLTKTKELGIGFS